MVLFKLCKTYDCWIDTDREKTLLRIEILQALKKKDLFNSRIWTCNLYNLYPSLVNTSVNGIDLRKIHSADAVNVDITTLILKDEEVMSGFSCKNEENAFNYVFLQTKKILCHKKKK